MRRRLAAILLALGLLGAPAQAAHAGQAQACNQFIFHGIYFDNVNNSYVYQYYVERGDGSFCWAYFQRVPGHYAAPDRTTAPWLFLPPPPPNNRPHGALVALYSFDFNAIDAHRGSRPLPPMYTFDGGTTAAGFSTVVLRPIGVDDPAFNTRLSMGDVVVFDVRAVLVHTSGGPGGHDQSTWGKDALADFLAGAFIRLPAHSGY